MIKATLLALLASSPALAQSNCGPHDFVVSRLLEGYGETLQSIGLGANNTIVETFASLATGTWTITVTGPEKVTCIVASGQSFEALTGPTGQRL